MLGRTDRRWRQLLLIGVFVVSAVALGGRLAFWQVIEAGRLQHQAIGQIQATMLEPSRRGNIVDRHGNVLATTEYRDLLAAYPPRISPPKRAAMVAELGPILGLDGAGTERVSKLLESTDRYVILARELTESQSERIRSAVADRRMTGLALEPKPVRSYPNAGGAPGSTLASQLLGFVDRAGEGHYGIEQSYQTLLAGQPRRVTALRDPFGRPLGGTEVVRDPGVPGAPISLTIDASLQLQVEKELYAAWVADKARRVSAVVLDPDTGDVLAWASVPGYDANEAATVAGTSPSLFHDPIASEVYEPGSVMKMFTASAALERGVLTAKTPIQDTAGLRVARNVIHNFDRKGKGRIPFQDVIAFSRNVGTARAAAMLGEDVTSAAKVLYDTWTRLGVGKPTGVGVSDEVAGISADPTRKRWAAIDLANRSFGQGVAVTPIQLASAFGTMANGGMRVQPHLLRAVADEPAEPPAKVRVLDAALSDELRRLMVHVLTGVPYYDEGTRIPGYLVGGKTGTAQIWDVREGRWERNIYNFSFAGFVGRDRPQAIVVTRIHEARPDVARVGDFRMGITSYELFRRIAIDIIDALDIPPVETTPATANVARP
jgi:cell division protein FtsI (penicillin-binding protein 3)